jgi:hypothetical protein
MFFNKGKLMEQRKEIVEWGKKNGFDVKKKDSKKKSN